MPFLFEKLDNEEALLLPDNLLHTGSSMHNLVTQVEEELWEDVEIIGWIYQFCAVDDETVIQEGLESVKRILADNYVRPDEAEKIKSKIKEMGNFKVIDKVTVRLNEVTLF